MPENAFAPALDPYSIPPNPLAGFKEDYFLRGGRGREEKEKRGREGKGEVKGEGKGKGHRHTGTSFSPLQALTKTRLPRVHIHELQGAVI